MKRGSFAAGFLTCLLVVGVTTTAYAAGIVAERSTNRIVIDGKEVQMEAYVINGNNYVKLRDIGKAVGFEVYWDSENGCVQVESGKPYVLDARAAVLGLAANERVTEVMFVFGNVKAGFAQVETPYIYATARSGLANNSGIVNVADVGGLYNGQWIQAVSRWLTTVYTKTTVKLPKTGY